MEDLTKELNGLFEDGKKLFENDIKRIWGWNPEGLKSVEIFRRELLTILSVIAEELTAIRYKMN